jgi:glyoxylase-like metal-dependent hydrolase (beta-lactamase superfamily II)
VTFTDSYTLEVGGERVELAWHGPNHSPDNIYIHFPGHDTLMFIDVVNAGWIPIYNLSLSDDVIGYSGAPAIALDYPWTHLISGHLGRVATREDVAMHQQYIADIEASSREAPTSRSSPGPRRSRSCSRSASTAAPAARSIPERNGSLRIRT